MDGLSRSKPSNVCMVVGCDKPAWYRRGTSSNRGYCAKHKALAMRSVRENDHNAKGLANLVEPEPDGESEG